MKKHPYFEYSIKGHHVTEEQVNEALENVVERMIQEDGRIRIWGYVAERSKYLRVILLPDGETLFNAFFDSNYTRKRGRP